MDTQELITIIQAAQISGKSIQTMRRMIKQRKLRVKKQKTPQGFNYLIVKSSLDELMNDAHSKAFFNDYPSAPVMQPQTPVNQQTQEQSQPLNTRTEHATTYEMPTQETTREHRAINQEIIEEFRGEVGKFNTTIQKLIEQHQSDKTNFFDLIKTFQDRVIILENQIKQLEAPKPSWWKIWK